MTHYDVLELSSVALGGKIVSVSDEFFAEAFNLLKVEVSGICYYCMCQCLDVIPVCTSPPRA